MQVSWFTTPIHVRAPAWAHGARSAPMRLRGCKLPPLALQIRQPCPDPDVPECARRERAASPQLRPPARTRTRRSGPSSSPAHPARCALRTLLLPDTLEIFQTEKPQPLAELPCQLGHLSSVPGRPSAHVKHPEATLHSGTNPRRIRCRSAL